MTSLRDVLKASKGLPVRDPIAEIWGRGLQGGYEIIEYTGALPITINANGQLLIDYRIYGNTVQDGTPTPEAPVNVVGCGEKTENLFDARIIEVGGLKWDTGDEVADPTRRRSGFISVESNTGYGISRKITSTSGSYFWILGYDENKNLITDSAIADFPGVLIRGTNVMFTQGTFFTTPTTKYLRWYVTNNNSYKDIMLNLGSIPLPYEPYGYKLPMMVSNGNTETTVSIYIGDTTLDEDEYVSFGEQKIYRIIDGTLTPKDPPAPLPEIPTFAGTTAIDYDGTPKPSQMYIKYRR